MSAYLAVHHPLDPAAPTFDFWAWRLQRRFIVDRLLGLATVEPPAVAARLTQCAHALEHETFGEVEAEMLRKYLRPMPVTTVREAFLSLAELTRVRQAPLHMHWDPQVLWPKWDEIPVRHPLFTGEVELFPVRARLPESDTLIPPYAVLWDDDTEPTRVKAPVGKNLDCAAAIWDWLVARKLTIAAFHGRLPWPTPAEGPLVLSGLRTVAQSA